VHGPLLAWGLSKGHKLYIVDSYPMSTIWNYAEDFMDMVESAMIELMAITSTGKLNVVTCILIALLA
jgi:hypothetical protein